MDILTFISTIVVALIGTINVVLQNRNNKKVKKQNEIVEEIDKKIEAIKKHSDERDKVLNRKIDNIEMVVARRYLIDFMSNVRKGLPITREQLRNALETKEEYNKLGGNSYVNEMWEEVKPLWKEKLK